MARILVLFNSIFKKHLLAANTCLSCVIDGLGDYLEQKLEGAEQIDKYRNARFASLGLVFGPWEYYWYYFLDAWFPGKAVKMVVRKVLLDEFLMSPIEYAVFYVGQLYRNVYSYIQKFIITVCVGDAISCSFVLALLSYPGT